tara:strand:- start:2554 stop:2979 length:426 start_codon:yes stop_codon:yes gene_type:complete
MTTRIEKTIFLRAKPEKVWAFLTEPDQLARWFHKSDVTLSEGQDYALLREDGSKMCWGKVETADAPTRLVYTFTHNYLQSHETRVEWTLEAVMGGTRLNLVHDGFEAGPADAFDMLCSHDGGWDEHFAKMREIAKDDAGLA